jgi:hypothetical protein
VVLLGVEMQSAAMGRVLMPLIEILIPDARFHETMARPGARRQLINIRNFVTGR